MPTWLIVVLNVVIAAFALGVTNHFAIQMLFHLRIEWRIFGRRVPFTPGIIPKRKPEIAASLGDVHPQTIVLSVSGREFRAITWLGVLLGGIIGLMQSIAVLWLE